MSLLCNHVLYRTCDPAGLLVLQSLYGHALACGKQTVHFTKHQLEHVEPDIQQRNALLDLQPLPSVLSSSQSPRFTAHVASSTPAALSCDNIQADKLIHEG